MALVCDVGGGTTDFSLIRLRIDAGALAVERIAIGDHLLLGGDNVDLALATLAERKIAVAQPARKLALTERSALQRVCSAAKERLLSATAPDDVRLTVLGAGRSVVGGTMTVSLDRAEVEATLAEFLPIANLDQIDVARASRAGLRELGLPYESDPAITRHLARFLTRAAAVLSPGHRALVPTAGGSVVRPDLLLFNGGFFIPALARNRITRALAQWFGQPPCVLESTNLETAVAIGAATYARLRAGIGGAGTLVKAGSGRAYYVALGAPRSQDGTFEAVCVLARGTPEGTEQTFDHLFVVTANRPVSFTLCSSTTRADRAGDIVRLDAGVDALQRAPLVTVFRYGRKSRHVELPVRVSAAFTEVGTLELWCRSETSD
ncbi:MAG TPA: Hsp70 family protein, partial [Caldimonas sp.]|nr:Hsp70 family protein [Caldimonas sp.]